MAGITLKILSCITTQPEINDSRSGNIDVQEMGLPCVAKLLIQMTFDNSRMISRGTIELISITGISRILHMSPLFEKSPHIRTYTEATNVESMSLKSKPLGDETIVQHVTAGLAFNLREMVKYNEVRSMKLCKTLDDVILQIPLILKSFNESIISLTLIIDFYRKCVGTKIGLTYHSFSSNSECFHGFWLCHLVQIILLRSMILKSQNRLTFFLFWTTEGILSFEAATVWQLQIEWMNMTHTYTTQYERRVLPFH